MNELKIDTPEGYVIDIKNSNLEKGIIKFKQRDTYSDIIKYMTNNKYWYCASDTGEVNVSYGSTFHTYNIFGSEKDAHRILAINKLINLAHYFNEGWEPNWKDEKEAKYVIHIKEDCTPYIYKILFNVPRDIIYFKSEEAATKAMKFITQYELKLIFNYD